MKGIEQIDARILRELLADGRKSFTAIAKEFQTTKDVIWKRYSEMKKAGIIVGATIQFNFAHFGYKGIATILLNSNSENLNQVLEKLKNIPDLYPWRTYNLQSNVLIVSTIKALKDLDNTKAVLRHNPINSFRSYLWLDVKNMPENLDFGFEQKVLDGSTKNFSSKDYNDDKTPLRLDKITLQIVDHLIKNGRISFLKVGKSLGISSDTVARRYGLLVENNYIKTCIQINPIALGYNAFSVFFISFSSQKQTEEAIEKLTKIPNLTIIIKISGDYDLEAVALVKDIGEIIKINDKIMEIPGIRKIESCISHTSPVYPGPREYISTF